MGNWLSTEVNLDTERVTAALDVLCVDRKESLLTVHELDYEDSVAGLVALFDVLSQVGWKVVQLHVHEDLSKQTGLASLNQFDFLWFKFRAGILAVWTSVNASVFWLNLAI